MNNPENRQRAMKKLADILTLRGSLSQAKQIIPARSNANPSAARKMHSEWNLLNR